MKTTVRVVLGLALALVWVPEVAGQELRKMGEFRIPLVGVSASLTPENPVVPKNIASGVRLEVRAGGRLFSAAEAIEYFGPGFYVQAELSGPGLAGTLTIPQPGDTLPADPLMLPIPGLTVAGDYSISNPRIVSRGQLALDVMPSQVPLKVIDQILVTSVKTRALTLDEIRAMGIVLDSSSYLGFQFTLGMQVNSSPVTFNMPVVFDQQGVPVPQPLSPPADPPRGSVMMPQASTPTIMPLLLTPTPISGEAPPSLSVNGKPIQIPAVLVIPGNVGFLKQHFSAQLFVANGAPAGSGLDVRDVSGTIHLPEPADGNPANAPLMLPDKVAGPQPVTLPILGSAESGSTDRFAPGEQGQAEWVIRGEKEGYWPLKFDINATLEGLPVGPVQISGKASGGVLVRNAYFDMTFTVPSVVRAGQRFKMYVTVTNIGKGLGQDVTVSLDAGALAGLRLESDAAVVIPLIRPGDAEVAVFEFTSKATGKLVASYLKFDSTDPDVQSNVSGSLNFRLGVGDRGVPLSPDTIVLPSSVDGLPPGVVEAAIRVLGDAWSVANAPSGTLPSTVIRTTRGVITEKALALAEAGLRVTLGQDPKHAVRDIAFDFHASSKLDPGFDQVLRQTSAGRAFAQAVGRKLAQDGVDAHDAEDDAARVAVSGPDFISFAVSGAQGGRPPATVSVTDAAGRTTISGTTDGEDVPPTEAPGVVMIPLGAPSTSAVYGLVGNPTNGPYTLRLVTAASGGGFGDTSRVSVTIPRGDGTFVRGLVDVPAHSDGTRARIVLDPADLAAEIDANDDGIYETRIPASTDTIVSSGPGLVSANVIGPETLDGASPLGFQTVLLFDRVVQAASAANAANYTIPNNVLYSPRRQLSGRLVFSPLRQPEGPYLPTTLGVSGIADSRGEIGPSKTVPVGVRLQDPGAVVTGRVLNADGTPAPAGGNVFYLQGPFNEASAYPPATALAASTLSGTGEYQFRYVRQDPDGGPFSLVTQDPQSGARRSVTTYVRTAGEQLLLDIVLSGKGSVQGRILDGQGQPMPGATVAAFSVTDPQSGGVATAGAEGRYSIAGITVGQVTVRAVSGIFAGANGGRIERAGTTATVDVRLDSGGVSYAGIVHKVEGSETTPVHNALVIYRVSGSAVAFTYTAEDGSFRLTGLPSGAYEVEARAGGTSTLKGTALPGAQITGQQFYIVVNPAPTDPDYATVSGTVLMPDQETPAADAVVTIGGRGVATDAAGHYTITGVAVKQYQSQLVTARSRDGLRSGYTSIVVNAGGPLTAPDITLSGTGSVQFTVKDPAGNPLVAQDVALLSYCASACGCAARSTDQTGSVRFDGLPVGTVQVQAMRRFGSTLDVARGSATITRDGDVGVAVIQFAGVGTVKGVVLDAYDKPSMGATVMLQSNRFITDINTCGLGYGQTASTVTDPAGTFTFNGINLGSVGLTATQPFAPSPVGANGILTQHGQQLGFLLKLKNTTAGTLAGTVYLPDGTTPVGRGVEVTVKGPLPDTTVETGADGQYHFARILPEGGYTVTVSDPVTGYVARESIALRAGEDAVHDQRLKGRGTVEVKVVDGAAQPVASAFVTLQESSFPSRRYEMSLGASNQGVATFEGVFEGPFSVQVSDRFARGGRGSGTLPGPDMTVPIEIPLTTTGSVRGHFYMPDQTTPVPNGVIKLLANGQTIGQVTSQGSGDIGAYSFDYVPAGQVQVLAHDPLTGRTGSNLSAISTQGQVLELDVFAQALGIVQGTVTRDRSPQPGAHVTVVSGSYNVSTTTDENGTYSITGVPNGNVVVTASLANGFLKSTNTGSLLGEGATLEVDVALRDTGIVTGRVLEADGVTAAPPSIVTIQVGGTGGGTLSTTTDAAGRYAFDLVPAGAASLSASVLGSIDRGGVQVAVLPETTSEVDVKLNGVGSLTGLALDSGGSPTSGTVSVTGTGPYGWSYSLTLASDGRFHLPKLLAGPFSARLQVPSGSLTLWGTGSGAILPKATTDLTVQVQPSGTVLGLVLRPDQTPAYGAAVKMQTLAGTVNTQTTGDGTFQVSGVPLGAITVDVRDPITSGLGRVSGVSLTTNGETLDVGTIVLNANPIAVTGVLPVDAAAGVVVNQAVHLTFNEPIGCVCGAISVSPAHTSAVTVAEDGKAVTITGQWHDSALITVKVSSALTDKFGRHIQPFTSTFRTVDLTAPTAATFVPANGTKQVALDGKVTVTFNEILSPATDLSLLVKLSSVAGQVAGTVTLLSATQAEFLPSEALLPNTTYTVTVNGAVDLSGNTQTIAKTASFSTLDTIAPTVSIAIDGVGNLNPASPPWVRTATPTVRASVSDSGTGPAMATAAMLVGGATVTGSVSGNTLVHTPATALAQGPHEVAASARDVAGNLGGFAASFAIDSIAPTVPELSGITEGAIVTGTVALSATSTETGSGLAKIEVLVDGIVRSTLVGPSFSGSSATTGLADGSHVFTARAFDIANNVSGLSAPVTVTVNNHPIVVSITSPAVNARFGASVTVTAGASKAVDRIEFSVAGGAPVPDTTSPYQVTLDLSAVPEGLQTITVTGHNAFNQPGVASRSIIVDHTPPAAPNAGLLAAAPWDELSALALGRSGAVEGSSTVTVSNPARNASVTVTAAADGSFSARVAGSTGETLSVVAVDAASNVSAPTTITITRKETSDGVPLNGMQLWLKADTGVVADATGLVSRWEDQSTKANHALQSNATLQPRWVDDSGNGVPALSFSTDALALTTKITSIRTVYWVLRNAAQDNNYHSPMGDANHNIFTSEWTRNIWHSGNWAQVTGGTTFLNGTAVNGASTPYPAATAPLAVLSVVTTGPVPTSAIGHRGDGNYSWRGDIAEVLAYDSVLSPTERRAVENYLALKYAAYVPPTAAPVVTPNGGSFNGSTTITLGSSSPGAQIVYTTDGTDPSVSASATTYDLPFTITETTTLKAVATAAGQATSQTTTATFTETSDFSPASLGSLELWLKADAGLSLDGASVMAWDDQSGKGHHAAAVDGRRLPTLVQDSTTGLPAIRFSGDDLSLATKVTGARTVFLVLRNTAADNAYHSPMGDANHQIFTSEWTRGIWHSGNWGQILNGQTFLNGTRVSGPTTAYPSGTGPLAVVSVVTTDAVPAAVIGQRGDGNHFWQGDIAEILIYTRPLEGHEIQGVHDYLFRKYSDPAQPPVPSAPKFNPAGGSFTGSQVVEMSTITPRADVYYTLDGTEPDTSSMLYDAAEPPSLTRSTTVKARAYRVDLGLSPTTTATFVSRSEFSPLTLGPALWLRADAVPATLGAPVTTWPDLSGNGNDAIMANRGKFRPPILASDSVTGKPLVRFNGNDLGLTTRLTSIRTVFFVLRNTAADSNYHSPMGDANHNIFTSEWTRSIWHSGNWAQILNGQTFLNGAPVHGPGTPYPSGSDPLAVLSVVTTSPVWTSVIGQRGDGNNWWQGDIAEIVAYDRPLGADEIQNVHEYLQAKYSASPRPPAAPTMEPNGGSFSHAQVVRMATTTRDVTIRYTKDGSEPTEDSPVYDDIAAVELDATTVVKARAFRDGLASATTTVGFVETSEFSPLSYSPTLWLRADAGQSVAGSVSTTWRDQSGNGNDALGSNRPIYRGPLVATDATSRMPVLRFGGHDLGLTTRVTTARTVFWVLRNTAQDSNYHSPMGDANHNIFTSEWTRSIWHSGNWSQVRTGQTFLDGQALAAPTSTPYPVASGPLAILSVVTTGEVPVSVIGQRGDNNYFWRGDIAEVIVYDQPLSTQQVKDVNLWLAKKYSISSSFLTW